MSDIIWQPHDIEHKIDDKHLLEVVIELIITYSTGDFLRKISRLGVDDQDIAVKGIGNFIYKNNVLFNYIAINKIESSKFVYEMCNQTGHLADYRFAVVDNRMANSFCMIFLYENDSFADYIGLPDPSALNRSQRNKLFRSIRKLAEDGIALPVDSIFYDTKTGTFSLFDYSNVVTDGFQDATEKREYINAYKEFLLL